MTLSLFLTKFGWTCFLCGVACALTGLVFDNEKSFKVAFVLVTIGMATLITYIWLN